MTSAKRTRRVKSRSSHDGPVLRFFPAMTHLFLMRVPRIAISVPRGTMVRDGGLDAKVPFLGVALAGDSGVRRRRAEESAGAAADQGRRHGARLHAAAVRRFEDDAGVAA